MLKKLFSLLLCAAVLLSTVLPVFGEELSETPTQTIQISSQDAFLAFSESCRLDSYSENLTVELTADIDLSGRDFQGVPTFSGTFLGNGHTISGLAITQAGSVQGLFRYLTATAQVEDLKVTGTVLPEGSKDSIGGIAGSNAGSIKNCSFSGSLSGSDTVGGIAGTNTVTGIIQGCRTEGELHGEHFVGGVAGQNEGVIRSCTNFMQVNTTPQQNSVALDQITLDTLTQAESAGTVTDIGGIAGHSSGVIRSCVNYGGVGYRLMGYNIGGIAGSQMGYIVDCVNYGAVSGRKDIGGIAGQMEPVTNVIFTEDALQTLQGQLNTLGSLAGTASGHVQGSASSINRQLSVMRDQAASAQDAVEQLLPDREDPTLPDLDSIQAAQSTLNSSLTGIQSSMSSISSSLQGTVSTLQKDMQAISNQVGAMSQTLNGASENLGGTITDISDLDTPEDLTGKVENCSNHAPVLADLTAGGIVGAIGLESDLDPEDDVEIFGDYSLNFDSQLRAVILNCRNMDTVTCGKQHAGGIVGRMYMGLAKDCFNSGTIDGTDADYVGGIAGESQGFIRRCSVKSFLYGDAYVGGIAGAAQTVSDCRSMTAITGTEKTGGVIGYAETREELTGNYYLCADTDPGAVDGISYNGCAQPLSEEDFLALEGLDPIFGNITVRFRFADGTLTPVVLAYNQALADEDIPALPEKEGCMAYWDGLHQDPLHFNTDFTAVYTSRRSVIESDAREKGMPVLLAEGSFSLDAELVLTSSQYAPQTKRNQQLLAVRSFTVSESTAPVDIRCLLPEDHGSGEVTVLLRDDTGSWYKTESRIEDSYVVFPAAVGESHAAIVLERSFPWSYAALAAAVILVAVAVILLKKRGKKKTAQPSAE